MRRLLRLFSARNFVLTLLHVPRTDLVDEGTSLRRSIKKIGASLVPRFRESVQGR